MMIIITIILFSAGYVNLFDFEGDALITDFIELQKSISSGMMKNSYIFCGIDEGLIKEGIKLIADKTVNKDFLDLNYARIDGSNANIDTIINACETMPFMSKKKLVVVYRASFLEDSVSGSSNDIFNSLSSYINKLPSYCVLIIYYLFSSNRDKPSNKIKRIKSDTSIVEFKKLKGINLEKKVRSIFKENSKDIGKSELILFCSMVENDINVITNEVEKLCSYTIDRDISKQDIMLMIPPKSDNDIFDLVDCLSQKKPERAIEILNELLFRGEKIFSILAMIQRQFKLLLNIKIKMESGKSKEAIARELMLNPYICEKMMAQSKKFSFEQLKNSMYECLKTEGKLKSTSINEKIEMEFLIAALF